MKEKRKKAIAILENVTCLLFIAGFVLVFSSFIFALSCSFSLSELVFDFGTYTLLVVLSLGAITFVLRVAVDLKKEGAFSRSI